MKNLIITFVLFCFFDNYSQQILGKLYYNDSKPEYVSKYDVNSAIERAHRAESIYLENKSNVEDLEIAILKELKTLKIDTLNIEYRNGLKINLKKIDYINENNLFHSENTSDIKEIFFELRKLELLKEDENLLIEESIKRKLIKEEEIKLKKLEEENTKLKEEIHKKQKSLLFQKRKENNFNLKTWRI